MKTDTATRSDLDTLTALSRDYKRLKRGRTAYSVTCYLESTRPQLPVVSDAADPRLTGVPGPDEGAHPPP